MKNGYKQTCCIFTDTIFLSKTFTRKKLRHHLNCSIRFIIQWQFILFLSGKDVEVNATMHEQSEQFCWMASINTAT